MSKPRIIPLGLALLLGSWTGAAAETGAATKGLFATGLSPVFPAATDCPGISSPFASPTRYDGSPRKNELGGVHSAIDITLPVGTPLLAVVCGTVVHGSSAGRMVGDYVWLHASPEDSSLPIHLFLRHQHLDAPSPLSIGTHVATGQEIARSGKTGTTGGHYRQEEYAHLHLLLIASDTAAFTTRGPMLVPENFRFLDPLVLYLRTPPTPFDNTTVKALAENAKRVPIPVRTTGGRAIPGERATVWPVTCRTR